ncbi:MAG: cohesin domain-containing protein [Pyrinomonadaceae bacterium]
MQIPDGETSGYVPAPKSLMNNVSIPVARDGELATNAVLSRPASVEPRRPAATSLAQPTETLASPKQNAPVAAEAVRARYATPVKLSSPVELPPTMPGSDSRPRSAAELRLLTDSQEMRVGERRQLRVLLKTDAPLALVSLSCHFDPRVLAVRSVAQGNIFADGQVSSTLRQMISPEGLMLVSVTPSAAIKSVTGAGVLLVIEVEALAAGAGAFVFNADDIHLLATDGRQILLKANAGQITVKQ